jgi:biopolymer transport protein ExbB/TolQ
MLGIFFMTLLICTVVIYVVILVFSVRAGIELYRENREFSRRFQQLEHASGQRNQVSIRPAAAGRPGPTI